MPYSIEMTMKKYGAIDLKAHCSIWLLLRALWDLHRRYLGPNPLVIWVSAEGYKVQGYVT